MNELKENNKTETTQLEPIQLEPRTYELLINPAVLSLIKWMPIEQGLPIQSGFYLATYLNIQFPDAEIRIVRMTEFSAKTKEFKPQLSKFCFDEVEQGLAKEWRIAAWAEEPEPYRETCPQTVTKSIEIGDETNGS